MIHIIKKSLVLALFLIMFISALYHGNTLAVILGQEQGAGIEIEISVKKLNDEIWMNEAEVYNISKIEFKIFIHNTGDVDLLNLVVTNILPDNLEYAGNSTPYEPNELFENTIIWYFSSIGHCCGNQYIEIKYYANVISIGEGINEINIEAESTEGSVYSEDTATVHSIQDTIKPSVKIMKPDKGLYVGNNKILSLFFSIIVFGDIDIVVVASDIETDVERVEFFFDENLEATDSTSPYNWTLEKGSFGKRTMKVRAFDNAGNSAEDEISIWKIL